MKNWLPAFLGEFRVSRGRRKTAKRDAQHRFRPSLEMLEDRAVPSTMSSLAGNFNGTAIPAGDTIWFNSSLTASGLPKGAPATLHVVNESIDFSAGGVSYHLAVPNAEIVF